MEKPFLTIGQQVELLRSRGVEVDESTPSTLMREGYYSIVNGYKTPFIDAVASRAAGDDRFAEGTTFGDLHGLFLFDRSLRELTFHYLIRAEATVRTAVAYTFAEAHGNPDDYLLQDSYCTRDEYAAYGKDARGYADELSKLTSILANRRRHSRSEFIAHYRDAYGTVPIWVLCNDLTFGNIEHFFNLMKPGERERVCRMIAEGTGRLGDKSLGYFSVDSARVGLEVLVKFRNICAHDERLYCAHVGDRKNVNYTKMVWMLERYLTESEFYDFLFALLKRIEGYDGSGGAASHLLSSMGFPELVKKITERRDALVHQAGGKS